MITAIDPKLDAALKKLRANPNLGPLLSQMEADGVNVIIQPGPTYPNSRTDTNTPPNYKIFINSTGDDAKAVKVWGIKGTTEENSVAHELGHVYWDYLTNIKKKPGLLSGKPTSLTNDRWNEMLSEATSRRFDNYTRPPSTIVPTADVREETVSERLDFKFFPFSFFEH